VRQSRLQQGQGELLVLDDVNLTLREGEIVGCSAARARASRRCCASSPA
jgi:ABC-type antimicrobial peptide transport system ATPase subunit